MAKRIPMIDGDEVDAFGKFKRYIRWHPWERKRIKTKYNRRDRKKSKLMCKKYKHDE